MTDAAKPESDDAAAKVVHLRQAVEEGAEALNGWAHDQAQALAGAARQRPLTAAGVSAGAAFAAGLVLGLVLARAAPEPSWKERILELKPHW